MYCDNIARKNDKMEYGYIAVDIALNIPHCGPRNGLGGRNQSQVEDGTRY
jgi:hypothetical protein